MASFQLQLKQLYQSSANSASCAPHELRHIYKDQLHQLRQALQDLTTDLRLASEKAHNKASATQPPASALQPAPVDKSCIEYSTLASAIESICEIISAKETPLHVRMLFFVLLDFICTAPQQHQTVMTLIEPNIYRLVVSLLPRSEDGKLLRAETQSILIGWQKCRNFLKKHTLVNASKFIDSWQPPQPQSIAALTSTHATDTRTASQAAQPEHKDSSRSLKRHKSSSSKPDKKDESKSSSTNKRQRGSRDASNTKTHASEQAVDLVADEPSSEERDPDRWLEDLRATQKRRHAEANLRPLSDSPYTEMTDAWHKSIEHIPYRRGDFGSFMQYWNYRPESQWRPPKDDMLRSHANQKMEDEYRQQYSEMLTKADEEQQKQNQQSDDRKKEKEKAQNKSLNSSAASTQSNPSNAPKQRNDSTPNSKPQQQQMQRPPLPPHHQTHQSRQQQQHT